MRRVSHSYLRHSARDMAALLQDRDGEVRLAALRCLGRIGEGARGRRFRAATCSTRRASSNTARAGIRHEALPAEHEAIPRGLSFAPLCQAVDCVTTRPTGLRANGSRRRAKSRRKIGKLTPHFAAQRLHREPSQRPDPRHTNHRDLSARAYRRGILQPKALQQTVSADRAADRATDRQQFRQC